MLCYLIVDVRGRATGFDFMGALLSCLSDSRSIQIPSCASRLLPLPLNLIKDKYLQREAVYNQVIAGGASHLTTWRLASSPEASRPRTPCTKPQSLATSISYNSLLMLARKWDILLERLFASETPLSVLPVYIMQLSMAGPSAPRLVRRSGSYSLTPTSLSRLSTLLAVVA